MSIREIRVVFDDCFHQSNGASEGLLDVETFFAEFNGRINEIGPRHTTEPLPRRVISTEFTRYADGQTTCIFVQQPKHSRYSL